MSRYIDAEELEDELYEHEFSNWCDKDEVSELIDNMPTADVVKVVRCKDCKWFNLNKWAKVDGVPIIVGHEICDFWGGGCKTKEDGYCSYGERKDDEKVRD